MLNDLLSSIKEINRLISKAMSNIYYWEKLTFSNFRFSKFKKFASWPVFWEIRLAQISLNLETPCCNLSKKEADGKWKTSHTLFRRQTLCLTSYMNSRLKVKLWWVGTHWNSQKKKEWIFCPKEIFLKFVFYLNLKGIW